MTGKITALLLAVLIANPFCCCFAAEVEASEGEGDHACCPIAMAAMAAMAEGDESEPAEPGPCDCTGDPRGERAVLEVEKPVAPQWFLLAEIAWEVISGAEARGEFFHGTGDPPDAVKPPGRVLSQVHCRYLL